MLNYLRLHSRYIFNKKTILIISIITIIFFIFVIFNLNPFISYQEKWFEKQMIKENYFQNSIMIIKLMIILLSCFLTCNSYTQSNNDYQALLISDKISKCFYFITKQITIYIWLMIIIIYVFAIFALFGYFGIPNFIDDLNLGSLLINLLILSFFYINLSCLLMLIIKNNIVIILVFCIYLISEVIVDLESFKIVYLIELFYPHLLINNYSLSFYYGVMFTFLEGLMIAVTNYYLFMNKIE